MEELLKLKAELLQELHELKLRYEGSLATLALLQTRLEASQTQAEPSMMSGGSEAASSVSSEAEPLPR